jgi:hypothetical protein
MRRLIRPSKRRERWPGKLFGRTLRSVGHQEFLKKAGRRVDSNLTPTGRFVYDADPVWRKFQVTVTFRWVEMGARCNPAAMISTSFDPKET